MARNVKATEQPGQYRPVYGRGLGRKGLVAELAAFFGRDERQIDAYYQEYRALYRRRRYRRYLSEHKTTCFEEAFIFFVLFSLIRPRRMVEIGTQYGQSTRRFLDIAGHLGLETEIVCYDVADELKFVGHEEVRLVLQDVTGRAQEEIYQRWQPDIVFLDARPYHLIRDVVQAALEAPDGSVLVIHDCTRGLCHPGMPLSREDTRISSKTGVWERHVLAEFFGIDQPCRRALDYVAHRNHVLRIFDTRHGLGVIAPRRV